MNYRSYHNIWKKIITVQACLHDIGEQVPVLKLICDKMILSNNLLRDIVEELRKKNEEG